MSREQFITKWRNHVAGVISLGTTNFRASMKTALATGDVASIESFGAALQNVGDTADRLVGMLYDAFMNEWKAMQNGQPTKTAK